ncbi:mitochondrial inner membrane protease ATP23 homolog [Leptopilina heterotoma]|uniref:mitochondrial inner membrane protease ATP23 homolog n=1 Tax=Leptopilina heterotoma TaxID=63436 RepID=UPI001CA84FE3|nr:mitochondrial inner membrane protease ATP23 homolog [Leptopilina heterotoma]
MSTENAANNSESTDKENIPIQKDENGEKKSLWGYDLYPERRGAVFKPSYLKAMIGMEGKENIRRMECETNVFKVFRTSPLVKLMASALKSSGCEFDIRRHVACEVCDFSVSGGYDPELNQIVICHNVARGVGKIQGVLTHEMIHMFDYCRNDLDFKNIDHLACTEIRAANLAHCSFLSSCANGTSSFINIKQSHQDCVKDKAVLSVLAVRKVSEEEARAAVERVFTKCYNDLEPIGRRIKRNSVDMHKAYLEAPMYGYEHIK